MTDLDRIIAEMRDTTDVGDTTTGDVIGWMRRLAALAGSDDERYRAGYAAGVADVKRSPYYDDSADTKPAALAGAAPVAWQYRVKWSLSSGWSDWDDCSADFAQRNGDLKTHEFRPLFTHAPAKAREVTDADVERACMAAYEHENSETTWAEAVDVKHCSDNIAVFRKAMRAALATFAEGE